VLPFAIHEGPRAPRFPTRHRSTPTRPTAAVPERAISVPVVGRKFHPLENAPGGSNALDFHGAKLEATVRWIATRCCVLVGDSLGRISLEVREGLAPEVAEREAYALGRRFVAETEAIFRRYTTDEVSFEIRYGTDYASHESFPSYLHEVHTLYRENDAFRALAHEFGGEYQIERWQLLAHEYLLEELALFACLAEDGWPELVYPRDRGFRSEPSPRVAAVLYISK
jgi:tRNA-dependent cyclodipeptide synthase